MTAKENHEDSPTYKCKLCRIKFPNEDLYDEHMESRNHKKKVYKEIYGHSYLKAKAKIDNTPISAKTPEEKPTSPKENQKSKPDHESSSETSEEDVIQDDCYSCEVCRKVCMGFQSYQLHLRGQKHQKNLKNARLLERLQNKNLMPKPSKEQPPEEESLLDIIMDKAEYASQDIECEICQIKCSGPMPYQQHCKSAAHHKKVAMKGVLDEMATAGEFPNNLHGDESPYYSCEVCQKSFSGLMPYKQHMEGIQHLKKIRRERDISKIQDLIISPDEDSMKFQCKECHKSFSGPAPFNDHLKSKIHEKSKKRASILKSLLENHAELVMLPTSAHDSGFEGGAEPEVPIIQCKVCLLAFSGPESARDHVESTNHKKAVRKKAQFKKLKAAKNMKVTDSSDQDSEFEIIDEITV